MDLLYCLQWGDLRSVCRGPLCWLSNGGRCSGRGTRPSTRGGCWALCSPRCSGDDDLPAPPPLEGGGFVGSPPLDAGYGPRHGVVCCAAPLRGLGTGCVESHAASRRSLRDAFWRQLLLLKLAGLQVVHALLPLEMEPAYPSDLDVRRMLSRVLHGDPQPRTESRLGSLLADLARSLMT